MMSHHEQWSQAVKVQAKAKVQAKVKVQVKAVKAALWTGLALQRAEAKEKEVKALSRPKAASLRRAAVK